MVGRYDLAGRSQRGVDIGNLIRRRDREIIDPGRPGKIAKINNPCNAGLGLGIDDNVVRIEVVMDGLTGQVGKHRKCVGFEAAENMLDHTTPVGGDRIDQRTQFGGVLKVPEQFVMGAAMTEIAKASRKPCCTTAETASQRRRRP